MDGGECLLPLFSDGVEDNAAPAFFSLSMFFPITAPAAPEMAAPAPETTEPAPETKAPTTPEMTAPPPETTASAPKSAREKEAKTPTNRSNNGHRGKRKTDFATEAEVRIKKN